VAPDLGVLNEWQHACHARGRGGRRIARAACWCACGGPHSDCADLRTVAAKRALDLAGDPVARSQRTL